MSREFVPQGEFLLYQAEDAQTRVQIRLTDGTLWLTQKQLAELYQVAVSTINGHLRTLYGDGGLVAERTIRKFRIVAPEGARTVERLTDHYKRKGAISPASTADELNDLNAALSACGEIRLHRQQALNPLSHAHVVPLSKSEVERAIQSVESLVAALTRIPK